MKHDLPSFAVLIDADNVRLDTITPIFEEITRHARITVRRIYGDFTSQNLANWKNRLAELAIQPIQQYRNTIGKNASDSALIIDAMDLLHSGRFEGFCLVSSDSDFTRLATRIREDGLVVYGFGEKKAPKAFVNACDRYIYVENLLGAHINEMTAARRSGNGAATGASKPPARQEKDAPAVDTGMGAAPKTAAGGADYVSPADATDLLMRAYDSVADDQGWAMLGRLSSYIYANHTDFDPRTYGCAKFIELLQKNGTFKLVQRDYKNGQTYFCRPKQAGRQKTAPAPAPLMHDAGGGTPQEKLKQALISASGADGWALIGVIGQKLKALGGTVKELGVSTLTKAVEELPGIESRGKGPARYFRMRPAKE